MPRVPVFGLPILNKPELMYRMLATFDHDVERLYIVDNGNCVDPEKIKGFRANDIHVADPGFNMGVGPAWNFIIRANINAPYWLIGCNDMQIQSGRIEKMVEIMEDAQDVPTLCRLVMGNEASWGNHFGLFAMNAALIDTVGWFDENIYPIYFEDTEFLWRLSKTDAVITDVDSTTHHDGNASWKGIPHNAAGNSRTWDLNRDHFDTKSGFGEHTLPFGVETPDGIRYTLQPRVSRLREQDWHVERKDNVKNAGIFE